MYRQWKGWLYSSRLLKVSLRVVTLSNTMLRDRAVLLNWPMPNPSEKLSLFLRVNLVSSRKTKFSSACISGIAFFQQICIPSMNYRVFSMIPSLAKNICKAPYSFERFPQKVLAGNLFLDKSREQAPHGSSGHSKTKISKRASCVIWQELGGIIEASELFVSVAWHHLTTKLDYFTRFLQLFKCDDWRSSISSKRLLTF